MDFWGAVRIVFPPFLLVFLVSLILFFFFFTQYPDFARAYQLTGFGVLVMGGFLGVLSKFYESRSELSLRMHLPGYLLLHQKVGLIAFATLAYGFSLQLMGVWLSLF